MNYAGFWKRLIARFIDTMIFYPLVFISANILRPVNEDVFLIISLILNVLMLLYSILFVYYRGKTPGKMIFKLRVIRTDGSRVDMKNSILREILPIISFFIYIIQQFNVFSGLAVVNSIGLLVTVFSVIEGFVYFFNSRCMTVHDFIADTIVIDESKSNKRV